MSLWKSAELPSVHARGLSRVDVAVGLVWPLQDQGGRARAHEGCGPPPQELSGPQASPAPRLASPGRGARVPQDCGSSASAFGF